jgi:hypothetical protein
MDMADRVLRRLERIEALDRAHVGNAQGGGTTLLAELKQLVGEAEAWVRAEGDDRARTAAEKLRKEAEGMH